ncbi:hypothetical protein ACFQH6_12710 [Halobacteriaceae archaeon GCM10025711]
MRGPVGADTARTFLVLVATVVVFLSIETAGTAGWGFSFCHPSRLAIGMFLLEASRSERSA